MANEYHLVDEATMTRFELGKWHNMWGQFRNDVLLRNEEGILSFLIEKIKPGYEDTPDEWFAELAHDLYVFIQTHPGCRTLEEQEMWLIEEEKGEFKEVNTIYRE